jgi:hypothetical protein
MQQARAHCLFNIACVVITWVTQPWVVLFACPWELLPPGPRFPAGLLLHGPHQSGAVPGQPEQYPLHWHPRQGDHGRVRRRIPSAFPTCPLLRLPASMPLCQKPRFASAVFGPSRSLKVLKVTCILVTLSSTNHLSEKLSRLHHLGRSCWSALHCASTLDHTYGDGNPGKRKNKLAVGAGP